MVVGFLIFLVVMSFCYFVIIRTLFQVRNFERNKVIKVIIVVVVVFIVFQLFYNGVVLVQIVVNFNIINSGSCEFSKQFNIVYDVIYSLVCVRCCVNFFLYAFIGVKFRNDFFKFFKDLGCFSQERFRQWFFCRYIRRFSMSMEVEIIIIFFFIEGFFVWIRRIFFRVFGLGMGSRCNDLGFKYGRWKGNFSY